MGSIVAAVAAGTDTRRAAHNIRNFIVKLAITVDVPIVMGLYVIKLDVIGFAGEWGPFIPISNVPF